MQRSNLIIFLNQSFPTFNNSIIFMKHVWESVIKIVKLTANEKVSKNVMKMKFPFVHQEIMFRLIFRFLNIVQIFFNKISLFIWNSHSSAHLQRIFQEPCALRSAFWSRGKWESSELTHCSFQSCQPSCSVTYIWRSLPRTYKVGSFSGHQALFRGQLVFWNKVI